MANPPPFDAAASPSYEEVIRGVGDLPYVTLGILEHELQIGHETAEGLMERLRLDGVIQMPDAGGEAIINFQNIPPIIERLPDEDRLPGSFLSDATQPAGGPGGTGRETTPVEDEKLYQRAITSIRDTDLVNAEVLAEKLEIDEGDAHHLMEEMEEQGHIEEPNDKGIARVNRETINSDLESQQRAANPPTPPGGNRHEAAQRPPAQEEVLRTDEFINSMALDGDQRDQIDRHLATQRRDPSWPSPNSPEEAQRLRADMVAAGADVDALQGAKRRQQQATAPHQDHQEEEQQHDQQQDRQQTPSQDRQQTQPQDRQQNQPPGGQQGQPQDRQEGRSNSQQRRAATQRLREQPPIDAPPNEHDEPAPDNAHESAARPSFALRPDPQTAPRQDQDPSPSQPHVYNTIAQIWQTHSPDTYQRHVHDTENDHLHVQTSHGTITYKPNEINFDSATHATDDRHLMAMVRSAQTMWPGRPLILTSEDRDMRVAIAAHAAAAGVNFEAIPPLNDAENGHVQEKLRPLLSSGLHEQTQDTPAQARRRTPPVPQEALTR